MFIMHDLIASFISSIVHKLFLVRHISAFQFISCVNLIGSCFQIWCVCNESSAHKILVNAILGLEDLARRCRIKVKIFGNKTMHYQSKNVSKKIQYCNMLVLCTFNTTTHFDLKTPEIPIFNKF